MSTLALQAAAPLDFSIFRPADAAQRLGVNHDTVLHHLKQRPKLFPERVGKHHLWSREQFVEVLRVLVNLCPKARRTCLQIAAG